METRGHYRIAREVEHDTGAVCCPRCRRPVAEYAFLARGGVRITTQHCRVCGDVVIRSRPSEAVRNNENEPERPGVSERIKPS